MTESVKKPVRARFAPSPTGFLHIGSARTALFNWLFVRQNSGKFVLRIEDTDVERSNPEYEKDIIEGLKWLGLDWDEGPDIGGECGPYRQSERLDIYEKYLKNLLAENKAYYCFCSKEQLESDRQAMLAQGMAPKYSGRCRNFSREESEKRMAQGEPAVIRFRVREAEVEFNDLIRGKVKFDASLIGDIVIARNMRSPLFNFSVVVDDAEMKISHVIRGEDHISNTPKQILIQSALGLETPEYAHIPLILTPGRAKMSKRFLETSLNEYKKQGYLSEAIVNFLALLGWHPADDREIFSVEGLVKEFNLKKVQKAGAVFNIEKLEWLNSQYIKDTDSVKLAEKIKGFIPESWASGEKKELLAKAVEVEKDRIKKLTDFKDLAGLFFELPDYEAKLLIWPRPATVSEGIDRQKAERTLANLKISAEEINKIFKMDFNGENLEKAIFPLAEVWGRGDVLWPLRAALSGQESSPGPFEIMEALGKEETLSRLETAIKKLE